MASLTARGRVLVVMAFLVSASLFAGAAVALVMATSSDDDKTPVTALPSIHPTLIVPSDQPTATPSATPEPTATPTPAPTVTVAPTATATPAATASPAPRRTSTAKPSPTSAVVQGLSQTSSINIQQGGTTADTYVVKIHATDSDGSISLRSVSWDAGTSSAKPAGAACPATAPADCRDFTLSHRYATPGSYLITIELASGKENAVIHFQVDVAAAPSSS